jgi:hypothetical protein
MLHSSYDIKDIKLLFELGDSARQTLLIFLDQFDGALIGKVDRSTMSNAEKQKMKRGINQLRAKGILKKSSNSQSTYTLNSQFIAAAQTSSREQQYFNSGMYKEGYEQLLNILMAIEHFFEEFYSKKFVIKYRIYTNTPRLPSVVFDETVQDTENCLVVYSSFRNVRGTILNQLIDVAKTIKFHCSTSQSFISLKEDDITGLIDWFNTIAVKDIYASELTNDRQIKALCKFINEWFKSKYPELCV